MRTVYIAHSENTKNRTSIEGVKAIFAGGDAFLIKVTVKDGVLYTYGYSKKEIKVYTIIIQGSEDMIKSLRPVLEQSWD